ncbi:MAG: autotransporter-associated beta strand repeat-containing protein [Wenzhouxiangella sp.]|nr:autotransporter-associated beta strand repeat-containing protein [Wenzhouxiangella sp.]MCH8477136.1 autotransporter-associated beta strand repeat-containing protein [Wenzhouxiangella sp.]TVR96164.1 MAG: hypothetical protein EA418_05945 [Wenzhouxiangellaceae bacterium]
MNCIPPMAFEPDRIYLRENPSPGISQGNRSRVPRRRPGSASLAMALASATALWAASLPALAQNVFISGGAHEVVDGTDPNATGPGTRPSPWSINGNLYIGDTTPGTLTITSGGEVSNVRGFIGFNGTTGTVSVTGAGSTWESSDWFYVATTGTANLSIADGASVISRNHAYVAQQPGSTATVTVTDPNSVWAITGDLYAGLDGRGEVIIAEGAMVEVSNATRLGLRATGIGPVSVNSSGILQTVRVVKEAGAGTLTLDGGILRAAAHQPEFLQNLAPGELVINAGGAIVDSNGFDVGVSTQLQGAGGLTKVGDGSLQLSGINTFSGNTHINAGLLQVNGSISGATFVNAGGTLGGSGTLGEVTIADGGTLAPGNWVGTLTVGSLNMNPSAILDLELGAPNVTGGKDNDLIAAAGDVMLDGFLNVTALEGFGVGTYTLITYAGALIDNDLVAANLPEGFSYAVDTSQPGEVRLVVTEIIDAIFSDRFQH